MVALGEYKSVTECAEKLVTKKEKIKPDAKIAERYEASYRKYKKIYPTIKELYKELI